MAVPSPPLQHAPVTKIYGLPICNCVLFHQLPTVTLQSSANEYIGRGFLGFIVTAHLKLDFHYSSPRCSAIVCSLALPSYLDDDAFHPRVFLCFNCTRPMSNVGVCGLHLKGMDMESDESTLTWCAMFCHTLDIKWCMFLYSLATFGHSHLFFLHKIQLVKTNPPPIQHSHHNP